MRTVIASTSILSHVTSGKSAATSAAISSHITMPCRWALDLVTTVSILRGRDPASSKAKRMMRSTPARVNTDTSVATSIGCPRCARPPTPEYSPSEFSRTITQSRSPGPMPSSGERMPGMMRVGRTFAYWSNPWQMGRRRPQSVTWSGTSGAPTAPKKMASNARRRSSPSAGIISPRRRYRSEPQSKRSKAIPKPARSATADSTASPASITSGPMPSAGMDAMR